MNIRRVLLIAATAQNGGDSGLGHKVLGRLREQPLAERWWLTLIGDSQFQIEHAMSLQISDLAIFIDGADFVDGAGAGEQTFRFRPVVRPSGHRISTMGQDISPSDVLHVLGTLGRRESLPLCFSLTLNRAAALRDNEEQEKAVDEIVAFIDTLLDNPDPQFWERQSEA